ncbi:hypothetical protein PVAR5_1309 [Paecilomyces variotii No. 5]|uniref:Uncharacterized protein n=1 Tax=Byssochlamys spectabilis (strain No. 5 / NBRC 109023) TaxID=1356009 RepID=V5FSQ7_BYSSN|nr:hypothetical protein PVAR5_1309 [Paecilomyces variotii No. 5]
MAENLTSWQPTVHRIDRLDMPRNWSNHERLLLLCGSTTPGYLLLSLTVEKPPAKMAHFGPPRRPAYLPPALPANEGNCTTDRFFKKQAEQQPTDYHDKSARVQPSLVAGIWSRELRVNGASTREYYHETGNRCGGEPRMKKGKDVSGADVWHSGTVSAADVPDRYHQIFTIKNKADGLTQSSPAQSPSFLSTISTDQYASAITARLQLHY